MRIRNLSVSLFIFFYVKLLKHRAWSAAATPLYHTSRFFADYRNLITERFLFFCGFVFTI